MTRRLQQDLHIPGFHTNAVLIRSAQCRELCWRELLSSSLRSRFRCNHSAVNSKQSCVHLAGSSFGRVTEASLTSVIILTVDKQDAAASTWLDRCVVPFYSSEVVPNSTLKCYCMTMKNKLIKEIKVKQLLKRRKRKK